MDGTCRDGALARFAFSGVFFYAISFTKMNH
jgi:hypothetical protein